VLCTDVAKDGMLAGPSLELYYEILEQLPELSLIASGGVTSMDDIYQCAELGCTTAIIGKAIYENKLSLKELERYQTEQM
jgi:phosphoribosylformimino-5-aminoimidazole carboxamide ribotide isomerase